MGVSSVREVSPRERLIIALDLASTEEAKRLVSRIGEAGIFYKIGMELVYAGGLPLVQRLVGEGKKVFLDLKLHDIPNTVERATAQVARLGASFLTIHAYPQTMKAAVAGAAGSNLKLLGVTALTSMNDKDLMEAGYASGVETTVVHRARQAKARGVAGLILSPREVRMVRGVIGNRLTLVTPGIRPKGAGVGDQKRVMTPAEAIAAGADHIVVGRPVTEAPDPKTVAAAIIAEIEQGLEERVVH
ncbi:MAG: orotidine-5'-phosphate decarboxylase [Hyphomicrobiales bacterium]|nr:orotidine-5'-phosphate decarboxylase [Hyphomicrobiales bacterium]MBV9517565.1 orotidine-5'-phosphate decarboxylase [Hyphomicrobiales bacterium]